MAHDLKIARILAGLTQWDLSLKTGIPQSSLSHAERGKLLLNQAEKQKIQIVLGGGKINWQKTESKDDFAMPREYPDPEAAYNKWLKKTHGMKIVRDGEMAVPRIVPADMEE